MEREPFGIHPALQAHIRQQSEDENRTLEESIIAEGCRDPLVVWKEQNVLVDGHHRKAICDQHGIMYSVVYRSFSDIEDAKRWMDLNQLGRRNLSKEDRDEMIRRLAASGVKQKEIAKAVGLERSVVTKIIGKDVQNAQVPSVTSSDLTVTARLRDELEAMRKRLADEQANADRQARELTQALNAAQAEARALKEQAPVERVKEVPVDSPETLTRLMGLEEKVVEKEKLIRDLAAEGKGVDDLKRERAALSREIEKARHEHERSIAEAKASEVISSASRILTMEMAVVDAFADEDAIMAIDDDRLDALGNVLTRVANCAAEALSLVSRATSREKCSVLQIVREA